MYGPLLFAAVLVAIVMIAGVGVAPQGAMMSIVLGLAAWRTSPRGAATDVQDPPKRRPDEVLRQRLADGDITAQEYDERLAEWHRGGYRT